MQLAQLPLIPQAPDNPVNPLPGQDAPQGAPAGAYGAGATYAPAGANMLLGTNAAAGAVPSGTMAGTNVAQPLGGTGSWAVGGGGGGGAQPVSNYAELVEISGRAGSGQMVMIFIAVLALATGGYFAYEYFINGRNPLDGLAGLFGDEMPEAPAADNAPVAKPEVAVAETPAEPAEAMPDVPSAYGPYALLPNPLEGRRQASSRTWTAAEEEVWRAGLSHRFNYQRYKTVQDVTAMKLGGSEAILWDALEERKLWTRMRAAMGLADMGIVISTAVVEKALGNARADAVAGYFKRFARYATPGQIYVMREALKVAAPKGRIAILAALNQLEDKYRNIYFAAATQDAAPEVQAFVAAVAQERGIPESAMQEFAQLTESKSRTAAPGASETGAAGNVDTEQSAPVDGPEAGDTVDGWDSYAEDTYYGEEGAGGEVEYYNTEIMQEKPGAKKKPGPVVPAKAH